MNEALAGITAERLDAMTPDEKLELLETLQAREIAKCAESFEYFLFKYVRTKDEHDRTNPVKRVPKKAYLQFLAHQFQHGPEVQYIAKSRQLMVSWIMAAFADWTILYQPHARVCFQSKKEEDAAMMIYDTTPDMARGSFILAHLPDWMRVCIAEEGDEGHRRRVHRPFALDQRTLSFGRIALPNGAFSQALAQGAAQVESKVPTLFLSDESSLQDEWRASWAAMRPCISGGGRAIAVATMRMPSAYSDEIATCDDVDPDSEMRGIARFRTASGGSGIRIHYSADPDKDPKTEKGAAWYAKETAEVLGGTDSPEWQQHYEINPQSIAGTPAIPYWSKIEKQVVIDDIPHERAILWSLDSALDYGARNKTCWQVFANDYDGNRYMVHEVAFPANEVGGIAGFARLMKESPLLVRVNGSISADPTMWNEDQNTTGGLVSKAQIFGANGIRLRKARANGQQADDVLLNRLHGAYWANYDSPDFVPRLFICRSCKETLHGLPRLRYQDHKGATYDSNALKEKLVDRKNDWWDTMKYAEVAAPAPAVIDYGPPPMSWEWLHRTFQRETRKGAYRRS